MQIEELYVLNLSQPYIYVYLLLPFKMDIVKTRHSENYILSVRSVTLFSSVFCVSTPPSFSLPTL